MRRTHALVAGAVVVLLAGSACSGPAEADPPDAAATTAGAPPASPDRPTPGVSADDAAPDDGSDDGVGDDPATGFRDRLPEGPPEDGGPRAGASGTEVVLDDDGVPTTYVVVEGDDLSSIALRFYPDEELGRALNRLGSQTNGRPLQPGKNVYLW